MFERFTDQTRRALVQEEARHLGHDFIGTEHLLLGLLQERGSIAAFALAGVGVEIDTTRNLVREAIRRRGRRNELWTFRMGHSGGVMLGKGPLEENRDQIEFYLASDIVALAS